MNNRHDLIKHQLARLSRDAGCAVAVEEHGHEENDDPAEEHKVQGKRPDLSVAFLNDQTYIDVSVTHPLAPSYVGQAALKHGYAAARREQEKIEEYKTYAAQQHAVFVPFVLESLGTLGKQARRYIDKLGDAAEAYSGEAAASFRARARSIISMTLQLGNARLVEFCRRGAVPRRPPPPRAQEVVRRVPAAELRYMDMERAVVEADELGEEGQQVVFLLDPAAGVEADEQQEVEFVLDPAAVVEANARGDEQQVEFVLAPLPDDIGEDR